MLGQRSRTSHTFGIVTLTHDEPLYAAMDEVKRRLYVGRPHCFIYNAPDGEPAHDTDLIFSSSGSHPGGIPMMIEKFIWFLETFLDREPWSACTHIVRANASTFLNLPLLQDRISRMPRTGCYSGRLAPGHRFVSGTCIVFSRDTAAALVRAYRENLVEFARAVEDDIVIAKAMKVSRVRMRNIPMTYLTDNTIPDDAKVASILGRFPLVRVHNYADRDRIDVGIWHALERVFLQRLSARAVYGRGGSAA